MGASTNSRVSDIHVDTGVLLFALIVSTATGIVMGLAPSLQASRIDHRFGATARFARHHWRPKQVSRRTCGLTNLPRISSYSGFGPPSEEFRSGLERRSRYLRPQLYETNFSLTARNMRTTKSPFARKLKFSNASAAFGV